MKHKIPTRLSHPQLSKRNPFLIGLKVIGGILLALLTAGFFFLTITFLVMSFTDKMYGMLVAFVLFAGLSFCSAWALGKLAGSVKKTFRVIGFILCGLTAFIVIVLIFALPSNYGHNGFSVSLALIGFVALILSCVGIKIKKKGLAIIPPILAALLGLMYWGVINDIPYVIRHIQGKNFIGIWVIYAVVVLILTFLAEHIAIHFFCKRNVDLCKDEIYSDSDLMHFNSSDCYKRTGYYLLKAKLHGMIEYTVLESTDDSEAMTLVDINPSISEEEMDTYCINNPQVHEIISYIKKRKASADDEWLGVPIIDVINNVFTTAPITGKGGLFLNDVITRLSKITNTIYWVGIGIIYYLGITKLMMGVYNGKDVNNLLGACILGLFLVAVLFLYRGHTGKQKIYTDLIKKVLDHKASGFRDIHQLFLTTSCDPEFLSQGIIDRLLRAYVLYNYLPNEFSDSYIDPFHYSTAIFTAILAARASDRARSASAATDCSSCSSCSGCSGCGGGCGGCGGCGD